MIKIYFFENRWHVNTRFSFGDGLCCDSDMTWETIVLKTLELNTVADFDKHLNCGFMHASLERRPSLGVQTGLSAIGLDLNDFDVVFRRKGPDLHAAQT